MKPAFSAKSLAIVILAFALLAVSAKRMELDSLAGEIANLAGSFVGLSETSQIGRSVERVSTEMFPVTISEAKPVSKISNFDPDDLPLFSYLETRNVETNRVNSDTLEIETVMTEEVWLVERFGYLTLLIAKMIETFEIAIWATLMAVAASLMLSVLAAHNFTPHGTVYFMTRSLISFFRAVPEIISALFMVLAFGFGPVAGILALGFHGMGFLGKFYAEEIESADRKPQEALAAMGAGPFRILRLAVWPQALPAFTALSIYILDRNVRMATVVGLVGAGGIGQELKGRYDLFEYDRVGTALILIFITILLLDLAAAQLRKRLV
ncbi:phosphonate ABC transporter, permease protein PhnE [Henriciella sp.]|uniref:phosphonate ABC transporter, permease protein PhnE n=1 Tax=Henriciella sp. TaxID=1968823 RepID=UPI002637170D|nr:phosphonate ABC transporter, permease protein PhnE [Henriciella sp.]